MEPKEALRMQIHNYSVQASQYNAALREVMLNYPYDEAMLARLRRLRPELFIVWSACQRAQSSWTEGLFDEAEKDLEDAGFLLGKFRKNFSKIAPQDYELIFGKT